MKLIVRNTPTPDIVTALTNAQNSPSFINASTTEELRQCFSSLQKKDDIRTLLHQMQNGLCAYCMSPINGTSADSKIEHYKPLSTFKAGVFDYNNYFLVCSGGSESRYRGSVKPLCCDSGKGNATITIDPENREHIKRLRYTNDGTIEYVNSNDTTLQAAITKDLNETLKLNGKRINGIDYDTRTGIKGKRKTAYETMDNQLQNDYNNGRLTEDKLIQYYNIIKATHPLMEEVSLFVIKKYYRMLLHNARTLPTAPPTSPTTTAATP